MVSAGSVSVPLMSSRQAEVSVRYLLSVADRGLKAAIATTDQFAKTTTKAQQGVAASMKTVTNEYNALARVAGTADKKREMTVISCIRPLQ